MGTTTMVVGAMVLSFMEVEEAMAAVVAVGGVVVVGSKPATDIPHRSTTKEGLWGVTLIRRLPANSLEHKAELP